MTIANTFASKLFVGVVAIAMALSLVAPAQAQTEEELQAQIDQLMSTINALQGQLGQAPATTGGSSAAVCPYAWTRSLSSGSTGADVMALQKFLNASADTQVAAAGAVGSAGMETEFYGPATAAAVSKFQVKYRDEILTPVGLVNGTGYFGPSSMAKANALCASAAPVDGGDGDGDGEGEGESEELSGEGTLDTFEVDDEEDEVQEGAEDEVVMVITAEATDGDIEMDRMSFTLVGGSEETDPWDAFEEVSLWVDGEKVADFDASDEDAYLDEDDGEFRFSALDLVLREDEETEIMVAVTVAGSVDGADADTETWTLDTVSVRYFDADGVATDEDDIDELGDAETFTIVEEGADDDASIESNSSNPDATTLLVEDDTAESDEYVVHIFNVEVDEDSSDLTLDDAFVDVTMTNPAGGADTTMEDVIADVYLTIDGEKITGDATQLNGTDDADETDEGEVDHVVGAGETVTVTYRFEFDGLDLEADTDYEAEVSIVFEGTDDGAAYENSGVVISTDVDAQATGAKWEVEGLSEDNVLTGTDSSEDHTLATVVPVVSDTSFSVERNEATTAGTVSYEFTVEADGENDYFFSFADVDDVQDSGDGVTYSVTGPSAAYTAAITLISGDATASSTEGWIINDGDEATFAIDFTFTASSSAGSYRVNIDTVAGIEVDETSGALVLTD